MKEKFEKYGIRFRILILFTLLVIIPFLVLVVVAFMYFEQYAIKSYGNNMADTLIAISTQIHSSIAKYEEVSMTLYHNGSVGKLTDMKDDDRLYIESALDGCCYSYSGIMAAFIATNQEVFSSGSLIYQNLLDVMDNYEDEILKAGGKCKWYPTDQLFGKANNNLYIMARALNSQDGQNVGILYFVISEKMITKPLEKLLMDDTAKYLLNGDGEILYSPDKQMFGKWMDVPEHPEAKTSGYEINKMNGQDTLRTYNFLEKPEWCLVSTISVSDMMRSMYPLRQIIIIVSLIYISFLVLMIFLLQHYIFRPLSILEGSMDQFAHGNLGIKMEIMTVGELKNLSKHFNEMTIRIINLIQENEQEVKDKNLFKMQSLVAQLKPHFLYNALNTIKWMAVINKQENIRTMTESLIHILMNAAKIQDDSYTLAEEIALVQSYATIQKARFMNFELIIESSLELESYKIHKFLLQPIVENAIIHGFGRGLKRSGMIKITIWANDRLYIKVTDNGIGFDVQKWRSSDVVNKEHTNIGLSNIEQMIRLEYGEDYHLNIYSIVNQGTEILYNLPVLLL